VNLVWSAARRFTNDDTLAEEITQAVFIILARKAGRLSRATVLTGWLYQTARLTAANALKENRRRQQREHQAYMDSTVNQPDPGEAWRQLTMSVPLSRFTPQVGGGSAFFVRHHYTLMKNTHKHIILTIGLFAALIVRSIAASPEAEAHFVADAKAALDAKDSSKLLSLVCWDGVAPEMKTMLTKQFSGMVQQPVSQVELVAPSPTLKTEYTRNGVTYRVNLAVIKQLKITYVPKSGDYTSLAIPVGEKDGKLLFTTAAPVK